MALEVIDGQVHAWAPDGPDAPWRVNLGSEELNASIRSHFEDEIFTWERVVAEMSNAGVFSALLFNPGVYAGDLRYALSAARSAGRSRLGIVNLAPGDAEDIASLVEEWRNIPELIALRVTATSDAAFEALCNGRQSAIFEAAATHGYVVNIYAPDHLQLLSVLPRRFPETQFVIDHLGIRQPPLLSPKTPSEPFAGIDDLIALSVYQNVAVKVSSVPSLSRERFPFPDVWPPLHRVLETFGLSRVIWGSDYTRVASMYTYLEGLDYIRNTNELSETDKAALLAGSLRRLYRWPPESDGPDTAD